MADKDTPQIVTLPEILKAYVRIRTREEVLRRPLVIDDDAFYNSDEYLTGNDNARDDRS